LSWVDREIDRILEEYDAYVSSLRSSLSLRASENAYRSFMTWLANRARRVKVFRRGSEDYDAFVDTALQIAADAGDQFKSHVYFLADDLTAKYARMVYKELTE